MKRFLLFLLLSKFIGATPDPMIGYESGRISITPPKGIRLVGQNTEILDAIECKAKLDSKTSVLVPNRCGYLHGLYRFIFLSGTSDDKEQVMVDFSISRNPTGGRIFLVGDKISLDEKTYPSNPVE